MEIYDAPIAIIENLNFVSDIDSIGTYRYCLSVMNCKHSVIRNCNITDMDNGIKIVECVNTLIDSVQVSHTSPMLDPSTGTTKDHYGFGIHGCTNTEITRVTSEAANSCIDVAGSITTMNTVIRHCNLFGGNRVDGFGMHENVWNTTLEDCVLGGAIGYGIITFNRCRFVRPNKIEGSNVAISYRGSHRPDWAKLTVTNCIFESNRLQINLPHPVPQNPIQAYDHVIGEIIIRDCVGGYIANNPNTSSTILSNTIKRMVLSNWRNCAEIFRTSGTIEELIVEDCTFLQPVWLTTHSGSDYATQNIHYLRVKRTVPEQDKLFVDSSKGGRFYKLPEGIEITFTGDSQENHYVICGKNIASNDPDDYLIGTIGATQGNEISRTISQSTSSIVANQDGNLVFTRGNSYGLCIYLKCFLKIEERSTTRFKCKLKNTGSTDGSSFKFGVASIDPDTGIVLANSQSSAVSATTDGAELTYDHVDNGPALLQLYLYSNNGVSNAETTIEDFVINVTERDVQKPIAYTEYEGVSRDGDGVLESIGGKNNIMGSTYHFRTTFAVDFLEDS